ncbi:hypothetical protein HDU87_000562 [Geranomyces variabilis]|uniref:Uncharacterized protein n=1 Tax=Geranomyces variabilis TaxID=109894 RepID=A0AAD5XLR5_9FUNG|nr:hypothetical protein HDU87_000562 [Geranomyces variabilis]
MKTPVAESSLPSVPVPGSPAARSAANAANVPASEQSEWDPKVLSASLLYEKFCDAKNVPTMQSDVYVPSFVSQTKATCVGSTWSQFARHLQAKNTLRDGVLNAGVLAAVLSDICAGKLLGASLLKLTTNADSQMMEKAALIVRSYDRAVEKAEVIEGLGMKRDEDTTVHDLLHALISETFDSATTTTFWANGESVSSREQRRAYLGNADGKKPDCRVLSRIGELLFMEVKPATTAATSSATVYDLDKLARFMQGSINQQVLNCPSRIPLAFAIHPIPAKGIINLYCMTLEGPGAYLMAHFATCSMPRARQEFQNLLHLIPAVMSMEDAMDQPLSQDSNVYTDDDALHLTTDASSSDSDLGLCLYVRSPVPTPASRKGSCPTIYLDPMTQNEEALSPF